jgi:hypothetical protein
MSGVPDRNRDFKHSGGLVGTLRFAPILEDVPEIIFSLNAGQKRATVPDSP